MRSENRSEVYKVGFISPPDWFDISPSEFKRIAPDNVIVLQTVMRLSNFYQNYEQFGQKMFPTLVTVFLPAQQTTIAFDFEDLTVDQTLPDSLFSLSLPSHVKRLPLSEFGIDFPVAPTA